MNHLLLKKQGTIFIVTKSINQKLYIEAQTSDKIQSLEDYEKHSTIVFDDLLLSKQESIVDLFFTRGRHQNIDIYYISQTYFHLPKKTFRKNSNYLFYLNKL